MNIRYSPRATRDLEAIYDYLIQRSPKGAVNVLTAIYLAVEFIRRHPEAAQITSVPGIAAWLYSGIASRFCIGWLRLTA